MLILFCSILLLGIVVGVFAYFSKGGNEQPVAAEPTCATCTGDDSRCEQECMMEAATKPIEYYDDEQLDAYRGRPSDGYTDEEVEEFAEVMYTLQASDVAGWNRSLILRGVNVPDQLKDELVALLSDS